MEVLPQQINEKQRRMNDLQAVLGTEPAASDGEMQALQAQHHQLQRIVKELEERKRATMSNPDDKLAMFRQQANLVAKKKDALEQRLASVAEQRAAVEAELADKGAALKTTAPVPKGEDLRKYGLEIRGKMAVFKRMKAELSELRSEWGIISRTQVRPLPQPAQTTTAPVRRPCACCMLVRLPAGSADADAVGWHVLWCDVARRDCFASRTASWRRA